MRERNHFRIERRPPWASSTEMRRSIVLLAALLACLTPGAAAAAGPAWTTYRHDAARSGSDPDSLAALPPAAAWRSPALDGQLWGQPLVYGSLVYAATENDTVYALNPTSGAIVWSRHLATPEPSSAAGCGDITPTIGITSTPVIDPATNRIYAVGAVSSGGVITHQLFALDASSGAPVAGFPVAADPPLPGGASAVDMLQRPALALQAGRIDVGYGGNDGDCSTYWGWLVSLPTNPPGPKLAFQADSASGDYGGAIWGGGSGPPVDAAGHVWVATGNGFGGSAFDFAESVIAFDANLNRIGYWAPTDWKSLDNSDADIGSSEPTLIGDSYVFQTGKDQNAYLINAATPGGVAAPAAELNGFCAGQSFGGSIYLAATSTIYAACSQGLKALTLGQSGGTPTLTPKAGFSAPSDAIGPPIFAGGLVWVTSWSSNRLLALDPTTGAVRFQSGLPAVEHFATPSAGGGSLFVGAGSQVAAFTIASPPSQAGGGGGGGSGAGGPGGSSGGGGPAVGPPPSIRLSHVHLGSSRVRSGHMLLVGLTLNRGARLTVTLVRRVRRPGRPVLSRALRLRAGHWRVHLRLSHVRPGRYTVVVALGGVRPVRLRLSVLPVR